MQNKTTLIKKCLAITLAVIMIAVLFPASPTVYAAPIPPGWKEVKTAAELKTALADTATTQIMFGANIEVAYGGMVINAAKPSLVIDGNGYTLIEYTSNSSADTIRLTASGALKAITFQNMVILGRNSYGTFWAGGLSGITFTYKNIKYSGPQLTSGQYLTAYYIDCDISLIPGLNTANGYVALAKQVYLEGNTKIVKEQPSGSASLFYFYESGSSITIGKGANVQISNNRNSSNAGTSSGFAEFRTSDGCILFDEDSYFNYAGNNLFHATSVLSKVSIEKNAQVYISLYGNLSRDFGVMATSNVMDVNENAVLDIRVFNNNTTYPVLQPRGYGAINFNNPKEVFIYNSSTNAKNIGLAMGTTGSGSGVNININEVSSIEYWSLNTAVPDSLANPSKAFVNKDGTPFQGTLSTTSSSMVAALSFGYDGDLPFTPANAAFKDINVIRIKGSVAPASALLSPGPVPAGWTEVKTAAELKAALADTTTTQIMFGANIEVAYGGMVINSAKQSLVIDGNDYRLTDYSSNSSSDTIRLTASGTLKTITFQNMVILGRNSYGPFWPNELSGITFNYKNVKYTGPQLSTSQYLTARYIDCDIALVPGFSTVEGCVAAAKQIYLEGNVNIVKEQPLGSKSLFYCHGSGSSITVVKGANVQISNNRNSSNPGTSSGFVDFRLSDGCIFFEEDSYFNYAGNNLFHATTVLNKVSIEKDAQVNISLYGNFSQNLGVMAISNIMDVNENAVLDIRVFNNNTAFPALQPRGYGVVNFNNPKEVFIYNSSTNANNTGLAMGPYVPPASPAVKDDINFNDVRSIEYWVLNTAAPDNLPAPSREFVNKDGSPFGGTLVTVGSAITSAIPWGYNGNLPFTLANVDVRNVNVVRVLADPVITGEATVVVIHRDDDTGDELDREVFSLTRGPYGPYGPKQEILDNKYKFKERLPSSAPEEGTINAGETKTIIFTYNKTEVTLNGCIVWDDLDNMYNKRPSVVTVHILRNGDPVQTIQVPSNGNGVFSLPGLDRYALDESEYVYEVTQEGIDSYTTSITGSLADGFVITNTLSALSTVEGKVLWVNDYDNAFGTRPPFVTIVLFQNGLPIQVTAVFSDGDGSFRFDGLEKYDMNGTAYVYSVGQWPLDAYRTTINGYVITNTMYTY